jgi:hypothetical protein
MDARKITPRHQTDKTGLDRAPQVYEQKIILTLKQNYGYLFKFSGNLLLGEI